jgi:hypothetical protein
MRTALWGGANAFRIVRLPIAVRPPGLTTIVLDNHNVAIPVVHAMSMVVATGHCHQP